MDRKNGVFYDQHFLVDVKTREKLLCAANLTKDDVVVEIGSGKGELSAEIAKKVSLLLCIELDRTFKPYLDTLQHTYKNIQVIYGNALEMDFPICTKLISNLPFSIVEPFVSRLVHYPFDEADFIVGNRFASGVIDGQANRLSLLTNCFFHCEKIMEITPDAFDPKPRVLSALVRLKRKQIEDIDDDRLLLFRMMFLYQNSKVKNSLQEALIKLHTARKEILTKREVKRLVSCFAIPDEILEKQFSLCTNDELRLLFDTVGENFR